MTGDESRFPSLPPPRPSEARVPGSRVIASILLLLVVAGFAIGGYAFYFHQKRGLQTQRFAALSAIADLKVDSIARWRHERVGDAMVLGQSAPVGDRVSELVTNASDERARHELTAWVATLRTSYGYESVELVDADGRVHVSSGPRQTAASGPNLARVQDAIRTKKMVFTDLERDVATGGVHLYLIVPVIRTGQVDAAPPTAFVLQIDARRYLFPFIQSWPTPTRTAETLLVRPEGSDVIFLNDVRHREHTALQLRLPLQGSRLPAAAAVRGAEGIMEGVDYRGVPVLAATRRIPDSPWFLVAKMDVDEAYGSIRERAWYVLTVVGALIAAAIAGVGLLHRRREAEFFKKLYVAEIERRALLQHYEYLTKYANDIILLVDMDGRIIEANERAEIVYGYGRDKLLDLPMSELLAPSERSQLPDMIRRMRTGQGVVHETIHRRRDGTELPVEVSARLFQVGEREFYQSIVRDMSERKAVEAALQKAKDVAIAANRAKDRILANVSHEIRTPMNGILGMTDMLLETDLSTEQRREVEILQRSVHSLLRIINDILDLSKIEASKFDLMEEPLRVRECIASCTTATEAQARKKQMALRSHVASDVPDVLIGDEGRFKQVLLNLLGNAVKFADRGEVELRVQLEHQEATVAALHVSVTDTGPGIPEGKLASIFEPFQQVDGSLARKAGGTGLGLTISKKLVEKMGGRIWVESKLGGGSTFHFTAQLRKPSVAEAAELVEPPETQPAGPSKGMKTPISPGLRVLVAEDHPINTMVIGHLLAKEGHHLTLVESGQQAVDEVATHEFDVVLMDVQMPEMDGLEATRMIRMMEKDGRRRVPIIAVTAHAMKGDRERFLEAGMDGYVGKPVRLAELRSALQECASRMVVESASDSTREAPSVVFDKADALTRMEDSEELLRQIVGLFLESHDEAIGAIKSAVDAGDCRALTFAAHKYKGTLALLAARRASEAAGEVERLAQAGNVAEAKQAFRLLEKHVDNLVPVLGAFRDSASSDGPRACGSS